MILDLHIVLAAAAAVFTGAFLQRISGMGVGLVVGPALGFLIGPQVGVFATNVVTITSAAYLTVIRARDVDWRRAGWILLFAIPGAIAGALLVRETPTAWLQVILGGTILLALLLTFTRTSMARRDGIPVIGLVGAVGGMLNSAVGVAAPAMVIYSRSARWTHPSFGATLQPIFLGMGIMSVTAKTALGSLDTGQDLPAWWYLLIAFAMVIIGALAGSRAAAKVSPSRAQALSTILAGAGALLVLGRGLLALAQS